MHIAENTHLIPLLLAHPLVILPVAELGPALASLACIAQSLSLNGQGACAYRIGEHDIDAAQLLNRLSHSPPRFVRVGHVLQLISPTSPSITQITTTSCNQSVSPPPQPHPYPSKEEATHRFDHNRLHPLVFTPPLHLLRRLKPIEVVDRHVTTFLREGDRELLAQPAVATLVITPPY